MLDYVLVSRALESSVVKINEEQLQWFSGSDHVAVYVEVSLPNTMEHIEHPKDKGIFLKKIEMWVWPTGSWTDILTRLTGIHCHWMRKWLMSSRSWSQPILRHMELDNLSVSSTRIGNLKAYTKNVGVWLRLSGSCQWQK